MERWKKYNYLSLATKKRDGSWVETPIWFAQQGHTLYCFSESKAGKVKRLRNFAEVRISPCNVIGKILAESENATAIIIEDAAQLTEAKHALLNSYGWQMRALNVISTLAGKINKRAYIKISLNTSNSTEKQ